MIIIYQYDAQKIKDQLTLEDIYNILQDFNAEPVMYDDYIIAKTICHNKNGQGSNKLYYYYNNKLFICYTECGAFDIYGLVIKYFYTNNNQVIDYYNAVKWVAQKVGISVNNFVFVEKEKKEDWELFDKYDTIMEEFNQIEKIELPIYDSKILTRFNYNVLLTPWIEDGISKNIINKTGIGYYAGDNQITIPHWDENNRFIGLRGRSLCLEDSEKFGKYRPMYINKIMYSHPLGLNLYGLNWSKNNISLMKKAIVVESEKSVLQYMTFFGFENSICVATCGSNLSNYQFQLLYNLGIKELIIAYDKQFESTQTNEFKQWIKKLTKINNKFKNYVSVSFIFDKYNLLDYKDSPMDKGKDVFLNLFNKRVKI